MFDNWQIERLPVPRGSDPRMRDGRGDDFSAYVIFKGGDIERLTAFYKRELLKAGYAIDTDTYGTLSFAGGGVEGGVLEGRGDVAVVINRS